MFEMNGVSFPLDLDSMTVIDRIEAATAKMNKAVRKASGKPRYEHNAVAILKTWCNEVFADDSAGEALLGFDSLQKILDTAVSVGVKIGNMRARNTGGAVERTLDGARGAMAAEGMTADQIEAAAKAFEQTAI